MEDNLHQDPESFVRGGPTLTTFVLTDAVLREETREDSNTTISGPYLAVRKFAIECWRGSFVII